jgi:hypothetical protein
VIKNVNAAMANVPAKDVKRENLATATVIVPAVKKNAAALNKIIIETSSPTFVGFYVCGMMGRFGYA